MRRIVGLLAACALLLFGASACSNNASTESGESNSQVQNQQDAIFASQLNQLSQQLVQLSEILSAKTENQQVSDQLDELARIGNERSALARSWLVSHGRANVEAPPAPGLLTDEQFDAVADSNGAELASAVEVAAAAQLQGMREICQQEIANGANPQLKAAAQDLLTKIDAESQILASSVDKE